MKQTETEVDQNYSSEQIDVLDLIFVVFSARREIGIFTIAVASISLLISLLLPPVYEGKTTFLPPQQTQSTANVILGSLGALAGLAGKDVGLKDPSDLYVAMLRSQTVQNSVIEKFDLMKVYNKKRLIDARKRLDAHTEVVALKEGLISVTVTDNDRSRAAAIANGFVDALTLLTRKVGVTEASRRRHFFEEEMNSEKEALSSAELAFKKMQETTGLIQVDQQGRAIVEAVARTRGQIAASEVQLNMIRTYATDDNPQVVRLQEQLSSLRAQLATLEKSRPATEGDVEIPTGSVPAAGLEYFRKLRDLKYHEALYEFIGKQLEAAKIDEGRAGAVVQVVDPAIPPEIRSGPKRGLIVLIAGLSALLVAVLFALAKEGWRRRMNDPRNAERLQMLKLQSRMSAK